MIIIVNPHDVKIKASEKVNEKEYNITKCEFEFSEEYTNDLVKIALFTNSAGTYKQIIFNNECNIPAEILEKNESTILGVYAYKEENEELILRYSPEPIKFFISKGSYVENAENSEPITPTDKEQIEQAIVDLDNNKQDKLIAGDNITIEDNVISATDTIYDDSEIREDISKLENDKVDKIEGKGLSTNDYTTDEKNKLAGLSNYDDTEVKSSISNLQTNKADKSEIPDVSNFVTRSVDNLLNYYLKSETYTKEQVNNLIGSIQQLHFEIVEELPTTGESNIIYLVPRSNSEESNVYDEYIYANNEWEKIGSTDIDLSDYVTTSDLNTALSNYTTTSQLITLLNGKANVSDIPTSLSDLSEDSTHRTVTDNEKSTWNGKVSQTDFENSQAVQDNAINNINNELDAFFKKTVSGSEIYLKQTLNWKLKLKINGNTGGVTGNNTIEILGKNVYDKNTPTEHIYYDDTGNPQTDNTRDFINIDIPVFDKFVISYSGKSGGASFIRVIQYDDNNNFVRRSLISTNNQVITTESNTARVLVSVNAGPSDYFTNLQIERGEIPTTYAEYQSQSYPINLGNIVLNENDYIYKNNGNWYTKISGTDTQITDNDLIGQLNTIENNAVTYDEVTYIYSTYASSPIYFNADIYLSMTPDLTNYVKNDDFAQNSSINGGVVRYANGVYGIRNVQNGYIGIVKPTDAEIEAQSNGWRVLTPAQLSKAVKEGVTNNSITLTATEKDRIRQWLGVERSWRKIRTVTIPSDDYKGQTIDGVFYNYEGENGIKNFSFHTDSDGNSLEGKGITGYVLRVTPTTNINVNQAFIGVVGNSMIIYSTNIKNTTSVFWYEFGIGPTFVGKTNNNPGQYQMGNRMNLGKELTSFIFNGWEATSVLGEGSKFEIWAYGYWD